MKTAVLFLAALLVAGCTKAPDSQQSGGPRIKNGKSADQWQAMAREPDPELRVQGVAGLLHFEDEPIPEVAVEELRQILSLRDASTPEHLRSRAESEWRRLRPGEPLPEGFDASRP